MIKMRKIWSDLAAEWSYLYLCNLFNFFLPSKFIIGSNVLCTLGYPVVNYWLFLLALFRFHTKATGLFGWFRYLQT